MADLLGLLNAADREGKSLFAMSHTLPDPAKVQLERYMTTMTALQEALHAEWDAMRERVTECERRLVVAHARLDQIEAADRDAWE